MKPADLITRYFNAANACLIDEACGCFAPDAVVEDEGGVHTGRDAIRGWIHETTLKYRPQVELLRWEEAGGAVTVAGRVSGNFPGSPVELDFQFLVDGETISRLSIQ
jgi:hypothetical protein